MIERGIVVFFALLLMISFVSFVTAAEDSVVKESDVAKGSADSESIADVGKEASKDLSATAKGFQENTNIALEQNVTLPPALKEIARVALGLKSGEEISMQKFVVLVCLFLILFLILKEILTLVPFFEQTWAQWIGALIISLISGISGGLQGAYYLFFSFADFIAPLGKYKLLQLAVSLIILGILFFVFSKLSHLIKQRMDLALIEEKGRNISEGAKSAEVLSEGVKDLAKK